jgi:hypothetical protein
MDPAPAEVLKTWKDTTCKNFMAAYDKDPAKLLKVATRKGKEATYKPDTTALKRVIARATLDNRPLQMVVYGGSVTGGAGCMKHTSVTGEGGWRWVDLLPRLSNIGSSGIPGSSLRVEVSSFAEGSTRIAKALSHFGPIMKTQHVDVVVVDYTMNDVDMERDGKDAEDLIKLVQAHPSRPALMFWETIPRNVFDELRRASTPEGRDPCNLTSFARYPHWKPVKTLGVPVLSYPDIACNMPMKSKQDMSHSHLTYWPSNDHNAFHPMCGPHSIQAHTTRST